ncbi:MAG: hypothetical protein N2255_09955 [Kiritimatiellae bacterium]|nr:hypothetical protein [Kiritimatiellia bacterium]
MSRWPTDRILWFGSWLALAFGVVLSIRTFVSMPSAQERLNRAVKNALRLREMESSLVNFEIAREAFEKLPAKRAPALESVFAGAISEMRLPELRDAETVRLNGWVLHRQEVAFAEVSLARVMQFIHLAETHRPPWRLVSCEIRSSPRLPGTGHVVALFESLEKVE